MKNNKILRDKIQQARVLPSEGTWTKIEAELDKENRIGSLKKWSMTGWAAAVFILVAVYLSGQYKGNASSYSPETLKINDQVGDIHFPNDFYPTQSPADNYRKNGRLVPNYKAIWKNPLMPAEKHL